MEAVGWECHGHGRVIQIRWWIKRMEFHIEFVITYLITDGWLSGSWIGILISQAGGVWTNSSRAATWESVSLHRLPMQCSSQPRSSPDTAESNLSAIRSTYAAVPLHNRPDLHISTKPSGASRSIRMRHRKPIVSLVGRRAGMLGMSSSYWEPHNLNSRDIFSGVSGVSLKFQNQWKGHRANFRMNSNQWSPTNYSCQ